MLVILGHPFLVLLNVLVWYILCLLYLHVRAGLCYHHFSNKVLLLEHILNFYKPSMCLYTCILSYFMLFNAVMRYAFFVLVLVAKYQFLIIVYQMKLCSNITFLQLMRIN